MRPAAVTLLLLLLLAPAFATGDEPVLVAKHAACFVHAVPAWPAAREHVERVIAPGHGLLHTVRETGKMTRLLEATGTVAVNTRRLSFRVTRILGVAADAERLYVLLWHNGRIFDRPPEADAPVEGGRYELRVFWLADGCALKAPVLDPAQVPAAAPPASLEAGPLKIAEDGVRCFGKTHAYDGRDPRGD